MPSSRQRAPSPRRPSPASMITQGWGSRSGDRLGQGEALRVGQLGAEHHDPVGEIVAGRLGKFAQAGVGVGGVGGGHPPLAQQFDEGAAFDGIVHCDEDRQTFQVRPFFGHGTGLTGFEAGAEMEGAALPGCFPR
jgi:hypothetical protein